MSKEVRSLTRICVEVERPRAPLRRSLYEKMRSSRKKSKESVKALPTHELDPVEKFKSVDSAQIRSILDRYQVSIFLADSAREKSKLADDLRNELRRAGWYAEIDACDVLTRLIVSSGRGSYAADDVNAAFWRLRENLDELIATLRRGHLLRLDEVSSGEHEDTSRATGLPCADFFVRGAAPLLPPLCLDRLLEESATFAKALASSKEDQDESLARLVAHGLGVIVPPEKFPRTHADVARLRGELVHQLRRPHATQLQPGLLLAFLENFEVLLLHAAEPEDQLRWIRVLGPMLRRIGSTFELDQFVEEVTSGLGHKLRRGNLTPDQANAACQGAIAAIRKEICKSGIAPKT